MKRGVHPNLLIKALGAIEPETTIQEFQIASGIASRSVARSVLDFFRAKGIATITVGGDVIRFGPASRLYAAMLALQAGCSIEQVSEHLTWKDFEKLAAEVLASLGYQTRTNVIFTKPRMEIDVVGINAGLAIAVDCKHWKRRGGGSSSVAAFARKQVDRCWRLLSFDRTISKVVPVIMTLRAGSVVFVGEGVPVVPVQKFRSFVMEVEGFLPEIFHIAY
ncbi:MAG TPA: restriction endonuclease [Nitrososphaera sp.]|nr:restriction endonuclease [Nitrososphaera sp.]